MYSVFSQQIVEHWKEVYKATHRCKDVPTEIVPDNIEEMIGDYYPQIMYCHKISTLDYVAEEAEYLLCTNSRVRNVAKWVCENIVREITRDSRKTFNVKLRIAVSMLNKLENEKIVDKEICLFYFDNIITNCNDLWLDYAFGESKSELPF